MHSSGSCFAYLINSAKVKPLLRQAYSAAGEHWLKITGLGMISADSHGLGEEYTRDMFAAALPKQQCQGPGESKRGSESKFNQSDQLHFRASIGACNLVSLNVRINVGDISVFGPCSLLYCLQMVAACGFGFGHGSPKKKPRNAEIVPIHAVFHAVCVSL